VARDIEAQRPPAGATHAVNWRSNTVPVHLGRALRIDILLPD